MFVRTAIDDLVLVIHSRRDVMETYRVVDGVELWLGDGTDVARRAGASEDAILSTIDRYSDRRR